MDLGRLALSSSWTVEDGVVLQLGVPPPPRRRGRPPNTVSACKSCGAPIRWVTAAATGKAMPVDAVGDRAHAYGPEDERLHRDRHTSHFATCPDAPAWRRRR